jgi:hypothetical protein
MTARTDEDLGLFLDRERAAAYYNRYEKGQHVSDYEEFMRKYIDSWDRDVEHYPYSLPHNALRFDNIDHLKRAVATSGNTFFGVQEMKMFRSRVADDLYDGRFFVTSEKPPHGDREYTVRWVYGYGETGERHSIGRFDTRFETLAKARTFAAIAAKAVIDHRKEMDL